MIVASGENYIGNYYSLFDGTFYTGKNPNDKPNRKLIRINSESTREKDDPELGNQGSLSKDTSFYILPNVYTERTKLNLGSKPPSPPKEIIVTPTKEQYENGEYQRYFLSKTNELKYIEIDQTQFRQYVEKQPNVSFQLYTPFRLTWVIRGDRSKVFNENKIRNLSKLVNKVKVPVIFFGGAMEWEHFGEGLKAGASAVAAANIFHYKELASIKLRNYLLENEFNVRKI